MNHKKISARYTRHYEAISKLGRYPVSVTPSIEEMKIPRSAIQSTYRDIKNEPDFKGGMIDFWCFVSMQHIVTQIKESSKWQENKDKSLLGFCELIVENYRPHPGETKNLLRYFIRNPNALFDTIQEDRTENMDELVSRRKISAKFLFGFWYGLFIV